MPKDYSYLRRWIVDQGVPIILECIPSRSGLSLTIHSRGTRIFTISGCGFDRIGTALGEFLENCFQPELIEAPAHNAMSKSGQKVQLIGEAGFEPMREIAQTIGLRVYRAESKSGTLLIIQKAR